MTHDNAEQLPDSFPEKVLCYFPGGRISKLEVCVELFQKDWPHVEYARIRPPTVQPTPASAMDGEANLTNDKSVSEYKDMEKIMKQKNSLTKKIINKAYDKAFAKCSKDKMEEWATTIEIVNMCFDIIEKEAAIKPVADFTDKYNSSDKPWCCWINQESGEECKNPARWDIRWPPFGYEDNTQSCDDHIFNLRGEGRNEIRKIHEPVAAPDGWVMVPRILETNDAMWQAGRASLARNDKASYGVQISLAWQEMLAASGRV